MPCLVRLDEAPIIFLEIPIPSRAYELSKSTKHAKLGNNTCKNWGKSAGYIVDKTALLPRKTVHMVIMEEEGSNREAIVHGV